MSMFISFGVHVNIVMFGTMVLKRDWFPIISLLKKCFKNVLYFTDRKPPSLKDALYLVLLNLVVIERR